MIKELINFKNNIKNINLDNFDEKDSLIISVDMINAFCSSGNLTDDNLIELGENMKLFFEKSKQIKIISVQDHHYENSKEFEIFAPHAIKSTKEAEILQNLRPFIYKFFYKNSLSIAYNQDFNNFIKNYENFIIVGNCTDLCVNATIAHLALSGFERNIKRNIYAVANLINTFNTEGHDAEFHHLFFLRHFNFAYGVHIVNFNEK